MPGGSQHYSYLLQHDIGAPLTVINGNVEVSEVYILIAVGIWGKTETEKIVRFGMMVV